MHRISATTKNISPAHSSICLSILTSSHFTCLSSPYTASSKFLFTAKNVRLHSCLTFDSVGFTPAGGGSAPSGVNLKSPSSYTQLQTSELRMSVLASIVSHKWL
jgi:hypothetical protein